MSTKNEKTKDIVNGDKKADKKEKKDPNNDRPPVSFLTLFTYASKWDKTLIFIGIIFSIIMGTGFPTLVILMGQMTDCFVAYQAIYDYVHLPFDNQTTRIEFYNTEVKGLNLNTTEILDKYDEYYLHLLNKTIMRDLRTLLDESWEEIEEVFTDSVFGNGTLYIERLKHDSGKWSKWMGINAVGFILCNYVALAAWAQAAKNQVFRMKLKFFRAIIHQEISWFDKQTSGDFASKITSDLDIILDGMGDKVALCLISFATVLCSLGVAFYYGWKLTFVIMSSMPVMAASFIVMGLIQARFAVNESIAYSKAGAIAEEVIKLVRTVYAFGGQEKEVERYNANVHPAKKSGIKRGMYTGISMGGMWFSIYASYGLAFWYGVKLIIRSRDNHEDPPKYDSSTLLIVFFNVLIGTFSMGNTSPNFEAIARARGAATLIFEILNSIPKIDSLSPLGEKVTNLRGAIEFRNVYFNYPARKDIPILRGLNLEAQPGQTVALVGPSGCGKSTIIQLIQRFYDPDSGDVFIDGKNIKNLNVGSLRDHIGLVGQEPVLFGYSIKENIKLGNPSATMEDIIQATKDANCYNFIQKLPKKFDTLVGESGGHLSGGQKQRIAIARALVRQPTILLLDESTSALDSESEAIVQAALDRASIGRTTFVVAHRLSTIRNADKIVVIEAGRIKEMGTHNELIEAQGLYYGMAKLQQLHHLIGSGEEDESTITISPRMKRPSESRVSVHEEEEIIVVPEQEKEKEKDVSISRLLGLILPDKYLVVIATICAFLVGVSTPIYSLLFGEILSVLSSTDSHYIHKEVRKYAFIFVALGIGVGVSYFFQTYLFGIVSENLTFRLRQATFRAILRQEIGWFDQKENSTGAICARLSQDAASVQGATGSRLAVLAQLLSLLTVGCTMSLCYNGKLGLLVIAFIPILLIAVTIQFQMLMGIQSSNQKVTLEATKIAVEAISNIRTVASLHNETIFLTRYEKSLADDYRRSRWEAHIRGFAFGFSQGLFNVAYAVSLFYGSRLVAKDEITYGNLFKCNQTVVVGTSMIGQAFAFSPDYQKGRKAAIAIFRLLDRIPKIIVSNTVGKKKDNFSGNVDFHDVEFRYPSRPESKILKGITFSVKQGQTVALVGTSGCGKSTCTALLERFYNPENGEVLVDGENILEFNIPWLRQQMSIVSQEPILFDKTIRENIAYGDNTRDNVPMEEIVRAAQQANIHNFIQSLPQGYDTSVGNKGVALSGGQKQRIAIARALLRNPRILLLDEATSALDSESEKIVQQAIDEARSGRTCIIIAHRLSTIQNVDKIVVISNGLIIEEGNHEELMNLRGVYHQMYNTQVGMT